MFVDESLRGCAYRMPPGTTCAKRNGHDYAFAHAARTMVHSYNDCCPRSCDHARDAGLQNAARRQSGTGRRAGLTGNAAARSTLRCSPPFDSNRTETSCLERSRVRKV